MTLASLRANLAAASAWWRLRPWAAAVVDMTTPQAVEQGVSVLTLPKAVQVLYLKAPPLSLRTILQQMEALERGFPAGGGKLHATFVRDENGEWTWTHVRLEPPPQTVTRGPGMQPKPRFTTTGRTDP